MSDTIPHEPERQFEFVLHLVSRSLLRFYNAHFRSLGLTSNEAGILLQLDWAHLHNQREIAEALGIGKAATGALIVDLESRGFVQRERNAKDARQIDVTLTKRGRAMVDKINRQVEIVSPALRKGIDPAQLQRALAVLLKVHANIADADELT